MAEVQHEPGGRQQRPLDLAARAGWLCCIVGNTQNRSEGDVSGKVILAERLGGETWHTQIAEGVMLVVQTDGENANRVHDKVAIAIDGRACHLFKADGSAVQRAQRHPLADIKDPAAHVAA